MCALVPILVILLIGVFFPTTNPIQWSSILPGLTLALQSLWTLGVIRLLSFRSTLSNRTMLTFLVLGGVVGVLAVPLAARIANPYFEWSTEYASVPRFSGFVSCAIQVVLLVPLITFLLSKRLYRVTSVADAFLLAFAIGLGYDLVGALLVVSQSGQPLASVSLFPPMQFDYQDFSVAGNAYWSGLIALVFFSILRFRPAKLSVRRWLLIPIALTAAVLFCVATEQATVALQNQGWESLFAAVTFHGKITAWISLLALLVFSLIESIWIRNNTSKSSESYGVIREARAILPALIHGQIARYSSLVRQFRLGRQSQIVGAELARSPRDRNLRRLATQLQTELGRLKAMPAGIRNAATRPLGKKRPFSAGILIQLVIVAVLFYFVIIFPLLPDKGNSFWSLPLINFQVVGVMTVLGVVPAAVLMWRYILSANHSVNSWDIDDRLQFEAERALLQSGLGAIIFVVFNPTLGSPLVNYKPAIDNLFPMPFLFQPLAMPDGTFIAGNFIRGNPVEASTLILLFVAATSGLTLARLKKWRRESPDPEQRKSVVQNLLSLAMALVPIGGALLFFQPAIIVAHQLLGEPIRGLLFTVLDFLIPASADTVSRQIVPNVIAFPVMGLIGLFALALSVLVGKIAPVFERILAGGGKETLKVDKRRI